MANNSDCTNHQLQELKNTLNGNSEKDFEEQDRSTTRRQPRKKEKRRKDYASSKKLLTSIKGKRSLGKKSPFTRKNKKAVSEEQEGCGQTSQQTSPDWFEGEENPQENTN